MSVAGFEYDYIIILTWMSIIMKVLIYLYLIKDSVSLFDELS